MTGECATVSVRELDALTEMEFGGTRGRLTRCRMAELRAMNPTNQSIRGGWVRIGRLTFGQRPQKIEVRFRGGGTT